MKMNANAKDVRNAINKMYSQLGYSQFCEYMGFNAKYDGKYWTAFQDLVNAVSKFDDNNLQKILAFEKQATRDAEQRPRPSALCASDLHRECDDFDDCNCGCHSRPNLYQREQSK